MRGKVENNSTNKKSSSSSKRRFTGCLLAGIIGFALFSMFVVCMNWGIWRSVSYELTGVEFPIKEIYRTDTSNCGRELGFWVEVYQLPEHLQTLLDEKKIDLKDYPMFSCLKWDGYTRITWTHEFPRNDVEKSIYDSIQKDIDPTHMPTVKNISDDKSAKELASHLLKQHGTLCGGWYRNRGQKSEVWVTDYFFYIINIEKRTLIMFGLDT